MSILNYAYTPSERLLPDPEPRPAAYTIISVDDHLVEPPWLFEGRLPAKFQADAPKIVENAEGHQQWHFDGKVFADGLQRARRPRRSRRLHLRASALR